jgi:hypothetical protein
VGTGGQDELPNVTIANSRRPLIQIALGCPLSRPPEPSNPGGPPADVSLATLTGAEHPVSARQSAANAVASMGRVVLRVTMQEL